MGKLIRYNELNAAYLITAVTYQRKPIFDDSTACDLLLNIITYNRFFCNFSVYGFIIMPDHLHIILQLHAADMSTIMRKIKGNFSRFYNGIRNTNDALWQRSFHDKGIRDRAALDEALRYMHNNPIRKGLVNSAQDFTYSSCSYYERGENRFALLLEQEW